MGKNNFFNRISFLFLLILIFPFSCSQNLPEARFALPSLIFEYEKTDSLPTARLSIFVESTSDVRRYQRITLKSVKNDYVWDTYDIVKFKSAEKMYAGYTNFVMPGEELIPSGEYQVTYENADGEKIDIKTFLNYDSSFYTKKADEIPEFMASKRAINSIIIFNAEKSVLYFGEKKDELSNSRKIWNKYRDAAFYQEVYALADNSVMCVMPVMDVLPDN